MPLRELTALIQRFTGDDGVHTTRIEPLCLYRSSATSEPMHTIYKPALCLTAQGRKEVILGEESVFYDPAHYLFATVELPVVGQVVEATPAKPYLAIRLDLDPALIGSLAMEAGLAESGSRNTERGLFVSQVELPVLEAVVRLVRLLETPEDIRIVAPLIIREIVYRLLVGSQGERLRQIASENSQTQRILKAIHLIKDNFTQPLRIEDVAREVYMSPSGLHHHFKAVTTMSPLQYQKQLRLQEARRLMIGEDVDAMTASYRVGYESPSQFSREYSRLFGAPPIRDIARLRNSHALEIASL
jgi:AraC-like DNA-binding protein